jgi:hypothetical protein
MSQTPCGDRVKQEHRGNGFDLKAVDLSYFGSKIGSGCGKGLSLGSPQQPCAVAFCP